MKEGTEVIFFDLDHTLWDYEANAYETLNEIFELFQLEKGFQSTEHFIRSFHTFNHHLWDRYNKGEIDRKYIRETRFSKLLSDVGIEDQQLGEKISDYFISVCPAKTNLISGALDLLDYLVDNYRLGVITNGFTDTQNKKLESTNMSNYFDEVVTSESASSRKPSSEIFHFALEKMSSHRDKAVMIGDNLSTDIDGASSVGMKSIWYTETVETPPKNCTKVSSLQEIHSLL